MDDKSFDISQIRVPDISSKSIGTGVIALLIVGGLLNTLYQIQPEEVGVVLRFGRYVRTTDPGLRAKLPLIETVVKVPVQRQLKHEFGFRTVEAGTRSRFSERQFSDEAVMLTGDLNVAVVEWIVQYRVSEPENYLFKVRNLDDTFRAMNEAIMREVVGDRTVTEVLTVGRQDIETRVEQQLQELVGQYEMGITVEQVVLQDVNPPDPVKPSWDEVNQAQQQRDRLINEARAEYNAVIPRARGEAQQAVLQAEGYALDRVNRAQGDAARFEAVYDAYRQSPEVTRQRLYLETMQRVLPKVGGKLFLAEDANGVVPLLSLDTLRQTVGVPVPTAGGDR
ncbi:MAG: FtsH protease activity modulator HflK [Vicinamibacterales bacterium]|jgi:membrane protease subunit HflK|nr:FtsH protease activity modulator HflK [Vicinamibacterales bacterium]HJO18166.1 FtsH protease activity modulator HflK [Vicinamibacterales bacterium]|tara:strand:+ start:16712 stop:17722 length:1011 start_codon:yes stop_codon:yes gene_type:complete